MSRTLTVARVGMNRNGRPYVQARVVLSPEEQMIALGIGRENGARVSPVMTGLV